MNGATKMTLFSAGIFTLVITFYEKEIHVQLTFLNK